MGLSIAEYRALPHFSYSQISAYIKSPIQYKKVYIDGEKQDWGHKPAMITGDLIDTILTAPDTFKERFLVRDYQKPSGQLLEYVEFLVAASTIKLEVSAEEYAFRMVGAKKRTLEYFKEEFDKSGRDYYEFRTSDITWVTPFEYDRALLVVNKLESNPETAKLLEGTERQKAFIKEDCFGGYTFKGLLDMYKVGCATDLKIVSEESPKQFESKIKMFNYHIQSAVYTEITGEKDLNFLVVNPNYPDYPMIWKLSEKDLEFGKQEIIRCLREIEQRVESNNWYYPITGMYGITNIFG
jgi:hypothetical protein